MTKSERWPLIVDYGCRIGSKHYFIEDELIRAWECDAPRDTWAFHHETGEPYLARDLPDVSQTKHAWMKRPDWEELTA